MSFYRIGELSALLDVSADTLRYYEKIGLLAPVTRNGAGIRIYNGKDVSRLKFIRRAQGMNFTLAEIGCLLEMRDNPNNARPEARALMQKKLQDVEVRLEDLIKLRTEMTLLINLCRGAVDGCPIIEDIDRTTGNNRSP